MKSITAITIRKKYIITPLIYGFVIFLAGLAGCKSSNMMKCPDLISSKSAWPHEKLFANNYRRPDHAKALPATAQNAGPVKPAATASNLTASTDKDVPLQIKLPSMVTRQMGDDNQLGQMNTVLNNFSADKVSLVRKDNGKIYLTAGSAKDLVVLTKNISKVMSPRGYYERRYGNDNEGGSRDGAAIAAGILGPIGFVFAFFPFLDLAAIPISLAAIITGAIGLQSHRKRLAVAGLTFGILGLLIAILSALIYFAWFFWFAL